MTSWRSTIPMWAIRLDFGKKLNDIGDKEMRSRVHMCMPFLRSHEEHSLILEADGEYSYFWLFLDKAVRDGVLEESLKNETLKDAFDVYGIKDPANIPDELVDRLYGKELCFNG